jgi:transposase
VEEGLAPFRTAVELITSIPGIKSVSAHVIVSEIGIDMSRFPVRRSNRQGVVNERVTQ